MKEAIGLNDECVQTHLSIVQGAISRMAENSSSCKTWCVTLVSAILVVLAEKSDWRSAWIAACPIVVFASLDAYYLALEKAVRGSYNAFVAKAHAGQLQPPDLYAIAPTGVGRMQIRSLRSVSIWGFYVPVVAIIVVMFGTAK